MKGLNVFLYVGNYCTLQNMYIYCTCDLWETVRLWMGVNDPVCRNDLHFPFHMIYIPQKRCCLLCGQGLVSDIEWCAVSFTVNYCVYHIYIYFKHTHTQKGSECQIWSLSLSLLPPHQFLYKVRELWFREVESQGSVPSRAETFLFTVQLESGAYRASYVMGVRSKVAGVWSWPLTSV